MTAAATHAAIDAVWRIESPRLIAGLARLVRDVGRAEELAQEALLTALERWPAAGVPDNPGAWLMADGEEPRHRRAPARPAARPQAPGAGARAGSAGRGGGGPDLDAALDDDVGDDLLRLVFVACHPVLSTEARVALTLRLLGGLTTDEIARAFLVPEPTIAQRIVRAKRTLAEAQVPFEVPRGAELAARLASVLEVIYLIFNEGYAATAGDDWMRPELCQDALRLGRILAGLAPDEPEVHGLRGADGDPGVARRGARRPDGRADPAAGSEPRALGSAADPARAGGARARRGAGRRHAPLHAAGGDRGLSRARGDARGDRLAAHRDAVRRAGAR